MPHTPSIAIDVEVKIMSYSNGMPYSTFHPENPFIRHNQFKPLPSWHASNKMNNYVPDYESTYWVIEEELTIDPLPLNLNKTFNCFKQVPSRGAQYKIKLCADVPYNDQPTLLSYNASSDVGHSFIVVTKSNGLKSVTQVFGFYASKNPGYLFPFRPMPSVLLNNQLREANAAIEMSLTEAQFEVIRKKALELAKQKYNAASYNCTNFGLDLFNSVRSKPLIIESYTVYLPNNNNFYGTTEPNKLTIESTPQMLFKKLKQMKDSKDPEASSITIDTTRNTKAPLSHGQCDY